MAYNKEGCLPYREVPKLNISCMPWLHYGLGNSATSYTSAERAALCGVYGCYLLRSKIHAL